MWLPCAHIYQVIFIHSIYCAFLLHTHTCAFHLHINTHMPSSYASLSSPFLHIHTCAFLLHTHTCSFLLHIHMASTHTSVFYFFFNSCLFAKGEKNNLFSLLPLIIFHSCSQKQMSVMPLAHKRRDSNTIIQRGEKESSFKVKLGQKRANVPNL